MMSNLNVQLTLGPWTFIVAAVLCVFVLTVALVALRAIAMQAAREAAKQAATEALEELKLEPFRDMVHKKLIEKNLTINIAPEVNRLARHARALNGAFDLVYHEATEQRETRTGYDVWYNGDSSNEVRQPYEYDEVTVKPAWIEVVPQA